MRHIAGAQRQFGGSQRLDREDDRREARLWRGEERIIAKLAPRALGRPEGDLPAGRDGGHALGLGRDCPAQPPLQEGAARRQIRARDDDAPDADSAVVVSLQQRRIPEVFREMLLAEEEAEIRRDRRRREGEREGDLGFAAVRPLALAGEMEGS